jgi:biopolymer transport protein ExbD
MNLRKKKHNEVEVFTDSLNDIIFILLMFFLIVSTLANPNVIKLSQPKAKNDTKA